MEKLYINGQILTMERSQPTAEAVLVEDGIIKAVGERQEVERKAGKDACICDLKGFTMLPGFIDGHSHITAVGYQLVNVSLDPPPTGTCSSREDVIKAMKERLERKRPQPGEWLLGMGYDNSAFPDGKHLTREELDQVSREIPVAAIHISGHLCVVNSKGMEELGYVGENYHVPAGGVVEPSGLLKEQAFLSTNRMRGPSSEEIIESVGKASEYYASFGITTAHDGKTQPAEYGLLKAAGEKGLLKTDVVAYLIPELAKELLSKEGPADNRYQNHLRFAGMKLFLDGSPQGKTAWLSESYFIPPEGESDSYRGFPVQKEEDVLSLMEEAVKNNWQINVHANGDEAIEQMIRCYGKAKGRCGADKDLRPVVIHCQMVREDQLVRMKELGMIASFFLDHVYYWGDYHYESVLGPERAERISPLRSAAEHGISFSLHEDSPVVPPNILFSIYNAVNRKTRSGRILGENQRITVLEALEAVTIHSAYQIFEENEKGSIVPGKRADFVLLDKNPLEVQAGKLKDIRVAATIKDGHVIFRTDENEGRKDVRD